MNGIKSGNRNANSNAHAVCENAQFHHRNKYKNLIGMDRDRNDGILLWERRSSRKGEELQGNDPSGPYHGGYGPDANPDSRNADEEA